MFSSPSQNLNDFFSKFESQAFKKGDLLLYAEEILNYIFYIKSGFVRAYRISESGEELTLTILKPTDYFPITGGIGETPNNYYLEAITKLEVQKAPKLKFLQYLKENPQVLYTLTEDILNRFGGLLTRMEYLVVSRAYVKVATTLLLCARSFGEVRGQNVVVRVPLTHRDIATLAGITRETTCLEMKKLQQKGLISKSGKLFIIRDLKGLEEESLVSNG